MLVSVRLDGTVSLVSGAWHDLEADPNREALSAAWNGALPVEGVLRQWTFEDRVIAAVWQGSGQLSADWTDMEAAVRPALGWVRFGVHDVTRAHLMAEELSPALWEAVGEIAVDWGYGAAQFVFTSAVGYPTNTSLPVSTLVFPRPVPA